MADPFSVIAASAGLLDVCWRVLAYLKNVQAAAAKVEEEIAALLHEIEALISVNVSIRDLFAAELQETSGALAADPARLQNLWRNAGRILQDCRDTVEKLEDLVKTIIGNENPKRIRRFDGFKKQLRKQSKDEDFLQLRRQLTNYQGALQLLLTALTLSCTRRSQNTTDASLDQLSENVHVLGLNLRSQIAALQPSLGLGYSENLRDSITSATAVAPLASLNKHFYIPQTVSSIFTGREELLEELKDAFDALPSPGLYYTQKRFVLFGLGGSGKTQFSCKFAQDNRQNFWGIFWIDASSEESAKHTVNRIAKVGGVEPNERAAKNWLSSLEYPWLLIIDSADDPKIPVENYFPEGERGHILVTTRNPAHQVHGTVGSRFCHFEKLEYNAANNLLLKAACEPRPWTESTRGFAALITEALGFLPLAIIHAGKAILNRMCTLGNYLSFYERNWQRIRQARSFSGDDINMNVYSSYEIIYRGLEATETEEAKDAVELLKIFSFLHCENIRVDVLIRAATNPRLEREEQEKERLLQETMDGSSRPKPWTQAIKGLAIGVVMALYRDQRPVLPAVLREVETLGPFDDLRLRAALKELSQLSLITHHQINDSYSMHPLVSTWVRERPQMSTAEQAVWCQAAATVLAQSILLPPLGTTEFDEDLRRDLLPHVDHAQKRQSEIQTRFSSNQKSRSVYKRLWPVPAPRFDRGQAVQLAKFSLIYSQCGLWAEAEKLQLVVKDFVCKLLGMEHPTAMRIVLALAGTYWQQTRGNEAAELQDQVLQACITSLGPDHQKTLKAMDTLGGSRCYQGRYKEALALHEQALEGMTRTLGADHEDTLRATDNLGRVHYRYFRFDVARDLHAKAIDGMTKVLGPTHMDTLNAIDNLAMTYLELGGEYLEAAHEMMQQVLEQRKKKLGKEQPYTLLAICNLARIKSALGDMDEAERLMRATLPIAERNLGENHFGTLSGRVHLAQVLVRQERYGEAEDIFTDVIQRQRYKSAARDGEHPDRIIAMWYLLQCYQAQGKFGDAIRMCDEISDGLSTIGGHGHPFAKRLLDRRNELLDLQGAGSFTLPETPLDPRFQSHSIIR